MAGNGFVYLPTEVNKVVEPYVDAGNLLIIDNDPVTFKAKNGGPIEEELSARVRENAQFLFNKIWELERIRVDEAICAKLPVPILRLPREKPLPEKRQLTKWEEYAQQKGIRKKKRSRNVFDERTQLQLVNQINRARFATASHGAFQPEVKNEKKLLKTGKHHKYEPNEASVSDERKKQLEILEKISSKKQLLNQARLPVSQQNEVDNREKLVNIEFLTTARRLYSEIKDRGKVINITTPEGKKK
ncbi:unnamed protein product [Gongylonema pulchrum]|uniref:Ribosome biogenesis regulatory protein n=1 Tax=Gongylonema pulchrum TaxID=637853 RepID=A0A183E079_9BILA|nr:unnamed protein product [Gongylonema pulchrum]